MLARAYNELSTCKGIGATGLGPIPWLAMVSWCEYHGLEHDVREHAIAVLRAVDAETIRRHARNVR